NEVGKSHTFTVHVEKNLGDGNGFVAAVGETVTTTIANSLGATGQMTGGSCGAANGLSGSGTTGAGGLCTVIISSPTAGQTVANASVTLTITTPTGTSGPITRDTDPATANIANGFPSGSAPATKVWVDARISITPSGTNEVGKSHT